MEGAAEVFGMGEGLKLAAALRSPFPESGILFPNSAGDTGQELGLAHKCLRVEPGR